MRRVLVLEDDDDLRMLLCELLQLAGVETCIGAASFEGMTRRGDEVLGCELALLDVNLGGGLPSGLDAHRWLFEHGFQGRAVFLTGHARSHPLVRQAHALEHTTVLSKPVNSQALLALLKAPPRGSAS